jgi:phage terminase large subunit-like protein
VTITQERPVSADGAPAWLQQQFKVHGNGDYLAMAGTYAQLRHVVIPAYMEHAATLCPRSGTYWRASGVWENGRVRVHFMAVTCPPERLWGIQFHAAWLHLPSWDNQLEEWEHALDRALPRDREHSVLVTLQ